jgi:hypothetical protein
MRVFACIVLIVAVIGLSGCGKRARYLDPPDPDAPHYPKRYPPQDSSGSHL